MNQVQVGIIAVVAVVVIAIIIYYIYQENKFKKMIERNFNQSTGDALNQDQGLVFESSEKELKNSFETSQKDIHFDVPTPKLQQKEINFDPLLDAEPLIEDKPSDNQYIIAYEQINCPFSTKINPDLDHVIDIVFEKATKVKVLPEINQFVQKTSQFIILEKSGNWSSYQRGQKYAAMGIKLVISLVDNDGVLNSLQLENLYNELSKFALHHEAHIRQSDSELKIRKIQQQLKSLQQVELNLELFIINREPHDYRHLAKYFASVGLVEQNGIFESRDEQGVAFYIADEQGKALNDFGNYTIISINSALHNQVSPAQVLDKIFAFFEDYVKYFESRLLTTNKILMSEKEFYTLEKQVINYVTTCKRQGIELGSPLIHRVFG